MEKQIAYNRSAMRAFTKNQEDIDKVTAQISAITAIAVVLAKQQCRAIITITALDIEHFEQLNLDSESKAALAKLTAPDGPLVFMPPPSQTGFANPPPPPSDEQKRFTAMFQNSAKATIAIDNKDNPDTSLLMIEALKQQLVRKKEELQAIQQNIYAEIFKAS